MICKVRGFPTYNKLILSSFNIELLHYSYMFKNGRQECDSSCLKIDDQINFITTIIHNEGCPREHSSVDMDIHNYM